MTRLVSLSVKLKSNEKDWSPENSVEGTGNNKVLYFKSMLVVLSDAQQKNVKKYGHEQLRERQGGPAKRDTE